MGSWHACFLFCFLFQVSCWLWTAPWITVYVTFLKSSLAFLTYYADEKIITLNLDYWRETAGEEQSNILWLWSCYRDTCLNIHLKGTCLKLWVSTDSVFWVRSQCFSNTWPCHNCFRYPVFVTRQLRNTHTHYPCESFKLDQMFSSTVSVFKWSCKQEDFKFTFLSLLFLITATSDSHITDNDTHIEDVGLWCHCNIWKLLQFWRVGQEGKRTQKNEWMTGWTQYYPEEDGCCCLGESANGLTLETLEDTYYMVTTSHKGDDYERHTGSLRGS